MHLFTAPLNLLRLTIAASALVVLAGSAPVSFDPNLRKALDTFSSIANNETELGGFCLLVGKLDQIELANQTDDQATVSALMQTIEFDVNSLGPDFADAWTMRELVDPTTPGGEAYGTAFQELIGKCQG